jgi:membrane protease YdiL (CAAX protease family)
MTTSALKRKRPAPPRRTGASRWTVRYALSAYVATLAVGVALVIALSRSDLRLGLGVLIVDAAMLASLVPLQRSGVLSATDLGLRPTSPAKSVGLVVAATIVVAAVNAGWIHVLGQSQSNAFASAIHESTPAKVLSGFAVAFCAPVVEEIFFRGLLYRSLRNRTGVARAALVAGVLFGLVHATTFPLDTLPPRMAFGIIVCLLYEYTASLYPGIALHSLVDATAFETSITGHNRIVVPAFIVLGGILLLYAMIRRARVRGPYRRARQSSQRPR